MEDIRKRKKIVLVNSERGHAWQTSKPGFKRFAQFSPDLVGVELVQPVLTFDKPIYVGFSVLDLSKLLMYEFHYNIIKQRFPNAILCLTDTDSFLYYILTKDIYEDIAQMGDHFDFSDYNPSHPLYNTINKAVLGKFKDETKGLPPKELAALRSKMYSLLVPDDKKLCKKTAAGVKRSVMEAALTHELYKRTLLGDPYEQATGDPIFDYYINQKTFRSYNHTLKTINQHRIGLTRYDDKRWICEDGKMTRPYGHYLNDT